MGFHAKVVVALVLVFGIYNASLATCRKVPDEALAMAERHEQWMGQYGKAYKDEVEKAMRLNIFKQNVEFIESFNSAVNRTYKLGVNQFADLKNDEFRASRNGYKRPVFSNLGTKKMKTFRYENATTIPPSMDWRKKGAVTGIKDQLQCGCCWAFSAVAAMEGANRLKTGKLISLSEQELVDCDSYDNNQGCHGGVMDGAFEFVIQNNGLATESSYPYTGTDGKCDNEKEAMSHVAKITGYENVPSGDESALLKAVANQPVSVAIDAGGIGFQLYSSGVFTGDGCGTHLDHGVAAVGYGRNEDGTKYWLVKNSWGTGWGEEGYIRMKRDVEDEGGLCGIALDASYPTA